MLMMSKKILFIICDFYHLSFIKSSKINVFRKILKSGKFNIYYRYDIKMQIFLHNDKRIRLHFFDKLFINIFD